jgi:hypothetical protein
MFHAWLHNLKSEPHYTLQRKIQNIPCVDLSNKDLRRSGNIGSYIVNLNTVQRWVKANVYHFRSWQISGRMRLPGFIDNRLIKAVRLSALWVGLLVLISVTGCVELRNKSMKIPHDPIVNRTRYLPTCSTVPQPTAPPRGQVKSPAALSRKKEPSLETEKEVGHDVELNRKLSVSLGVEHRLSYTTACSLVTLVNICTMYQQMVIWKATH